MRDITILTPPPTPEEFEAAKEPVNETLAVQRLIAKATALLHEGKSEIWLNPSEVEGWLPGGLGMSLIWKANEHFKRYPGEKYYWELSAIQHKNLLRIFFIKKLR